MRLAVTRLEAVTSHILSVVVKKQIVKNMKKKPQLICSTSDNLQKSEELLQSGSEVNSFQRHQRATLRIHCVGPTGLEESAMHYPLVKSH